MEKLLRRDLFASGLHVREDDEKTSRTIAGRAIVFDSMTELYSTPRRKVCEVIAKEAITKELLDKCDIKLTMFHDRQLILGRSKNGKGTLSYTVSDEGVDFECEMPDTVDGDKALALVGRGDIAGCSFAFYVDYDDDEAVTYDRQKDSEGKELVVYTIHKIAQVVDFTLAADPAYEQTSVGLREKIDEMFNQSDNDMTPQEARDRIAEIDEAIAATSDHAEAENREVTEEEAQQVEALEREKTEIEQSCNEENREESKKMEKKTRTQVLREALNAGQHNIEIPITREDVTAMVTSDAAPLVPIKVQEVVKPLQEGIIYDKVGLTVSHSNAGEFVWPVVGAAKVQIIGEAQAVVPQKITIDKLTARPERFAASVEVSYETLNQTENAVETIINEQMSAAVTKAVNDLILSPSKIAGSAQIEGPFVEASKAAKLVNLSATPTFKELVALKAKLMSKGVDLSKCVYVVSNATYCELEATPKDAGSGIMIIENGRLAGLPVFPSDIVGDEFVGLGDFSNQPSGFFGEMRLIVNPYSGDLSNTVRFTLNFGFATKTIRPEAFVVGKKKSA